MRKVFKRLTAAALAAVLAVTGIPAQALAAPAAQTESPKKLELKDDYISVTVSGENGGFRIDTLEGNKLNKSDNNKFLLYPAEDYDTSYTSFSVTRKDGTKEEYIFGRDYGFLGMDSSDVALSTQGNSLIATWSVKDLTVQQTLSLLDESAAQHGMVSVAYSVATDRDDVENVKIRLMLDTALGYQDYGVYELPDAVGDYAHIRKETLLDNQDGGAFAGSMFAVDDPGAPKVTAYTANTVKDGQVLTPYQVGFGHWNHLASTVFDFTPDETLDFTNPYNEAYSTADSAYALYYDLGGLEQNVSAEISTYYGVFSNATVSEEEKVAINFLSMPASMTLNAAKDAYEPQTEGGRPGDVSVKMAIENIAPEALDDMTVVVKTQNQVIPYQDWHQNVLYGEEESFTTVIDDYQPGETAQVEAFFQVSPLPSSEYRRFEVLCYDAARGEELTEAKLLGSRDFYLFCPGTLGEKVVFTSIEPKMVYTEGTKNVYLSGQNFAMLKDPTSYVTYLHSLSGGRDVIVPAKNVVVDAEKNTMYLVVDSTLDPGNYQVIFDWNEAGKEDTTSPMLQFLATDKPEYMSPVYGIVTIEKAPGYSDDAPGYRVMAYGDEEEYARDMTDPNNQVLLEFRGNFSLWYDEAGNITEAKAVSLENVEGKVSNTINISDCLDIESGSVSITVQDPGTDTQVIETNIDGKVYTTNSRTKVWDGVCAISSIENGSVSTLLQYTSDADPTENLENSVANTNAITLIWPGAASGVQTLAGIMLEFRYCQFGMMALEDGMVTDDMPKRRVIAFGAEMSPDFLVPSNYKWSERNTSTLEAVQLKIAKSNYTAEQLRDVQRRYAQDQEDWENAQRGSLALYVHDILFGGGFIGFNASVEVGLPSYADGLPGVEGTLGLKIMPKDDWWEVGVAGAADFEMLQMEASLRLKSYNGIPVPDNLYFYLGGITPGVNVDGMGIFWIQGLGGGFDSLYDTLFSSSALPPLTLMLSGQFALFNMLQARADLALSMRGFDVSLSNMGFANVNLVDYMGMHTYWYPKLSLKASLAVDILNVINGGGYLVLDENLKTGALFWEGFVTASVRTPEIPLIGSITVGSADLGVNAAKIWGALHVLKLDMGVTYYWGGDVDFSFGKYDTPEPTYPVALMSDIPVYTDKETGRVLYMSMGTNAKLAAKAKVKAAGRSRKAASSIESSVDRMTHTICLGSYTGTSDQALSVLFTADSMEEARALACGDGYKNKGIVLKDENGAAYPLNWLNTEEAAEEQENANALLSYNEETKQASVTISFTEEESYAHTWTLTGGAPSDLALYELKRLAGLDSFTYSEQENQMVTANWTGRKLEEIEHLAVYAVDEEDGLYTLYETELADEITGGTASFAVPDTLPTGSYTLRIVASSETNSVNDILDAETKFSYTNPNQLEAPVLGSVWLGGDYSLDAAVTKRAAYDGYIATVYEQQTVDGKPVWTATDFAGQQIEADEAGELPDTITVGGRYETTVLTDSEGNVVSQEEAEGRTDITSKKKVFGLEAGKTYCVGVRGYRITADGKNICQSAEVKSNPVVMRASDPANVTVSAVGAKQLTDTVNLKAALDTVNSDTVTIQIASSQQVSGTWYLDGTPGGEWQANGNDILRLGEESGLEEGEHILELRGENAGGDGVHVQYRFRVDVTAPRLQIGGPADGAFFGESVTVSGQSEPGAKIYILKEGEQEKMVAADAAGSFKAEIPMDTSALEQELAVYAEDASGNQSIQYQMKLTNELIGAQDVRLAIYVDGADCTNQTLPAGAGGALELRAVSGEKSLAIPADSSIGRQVEWSVQTMEGTASLEGQTLVTDSQVNGILLAELEGQSAGVVLGGNKPMSSNTYVISLPEDTAGYAVQTEQELVVNDGESFAFTVTLSEGYTATEDFIVKVNGVPLTGESGTYVIQNIHAPKNITVEGVADITAPEAEITVKENRWKDFLNGISFGIFYKESQDVTITAADPGSGIDRTEYYLSDTELTLEEVSALPAEEWTVYESTFSISPDRKCVIYARSIDRAGNAMYVSSDGMILDSTAPVVIGMENNGTYYGDQTFRVEEEYLKEIRIDEKTAEAQEGEIRIPADNKAHTIEVTDQAGNSITYQIMVYKIYEVQFVADDVVVGTKYVNYGSDIPADEFPEIPKKTGYDQTTPKWEPESLENVMEDTTVQAVYTINTYAITLPQNTEGFQIRTEQELTVEHGADFRFTVEFAEEYAAGEGFAVEANGTELTEKDGVYTITGIHSPQTITVEGAADGIAPAAEITVKENKWKEFLKDISFGIFYKESQDVTVTSTDRGSGIDRMEYHLSDTALTLEEVRALPAEVWTLYEGTFSISPDRKCVIYARSTDQAGNTAYVSSDGLILDGTEPVITGVEDGDVFYGDQTFRVEDEYLKEIRIDGKTAEASGGSITIPADNGAHIIEVTDQAGNSTVRQVTVYKIYTVQFVADGATIAARRVNHGSSISAGQFPEIPEKTGYDQTPPRWEPESLENVIEDTTVQAVYTINTYEITLPQETEGFQIHTEQELTVEDGADFRFTVEFEEEYAAGEGFAVKANGTTLMGENGVYTIAGIHSPQTITVEGVADGIAPTAEIAVKENKWKEFLHTISFGIFYKESQDVTVTATDNGSGVDRTEYHLSDTALTLEELKALLAENWTVYEGTFSISPDRKCVIYARSTDRAGNTAYVSSDGIILDSTAPVIIGMEDGDVFYGDQTFRVEDEYLKEIRIDGEAAEASGGSITIPADNGAHIIEVTDQAGNSTVCQITVYKIYKVQFVADGEIIDTKYVNHGSGIPAEEFPAVPEKQGYADTPPKWDMAELKEVTKDITIQAVYTPDRYPVTLPGSAEGYVIRPQHGMEVAYGESFSFTVEIAQGYQAGSQFRVYAGDREVTAVKGVYTVSNVQGAIEIRVQGVEKTAGKKPLIQTLKDNQEFKKGNYYYKVISAENRTVQVIAVKNTKKTTITVYNRVMYGEQLYKVTSVAENAFKGCRKATSASIGRYVRVINKNAFAGCKGLKKVTIHGNGLRHIRKNAFKGCKKLEKVVIKSKNLYKVDKYAFRSISRNAVIKVPAEKYRQYRKLFAGKGLPKGVKIKKIKPKKIKFKKVKLKKITSEKVKW